MTLKAIAGIVRPDAGRIIVGNQTLYDADRGVWIPPHRRRIGYVPQGYALFPHLTVAENIAFGIREREGQQKWEAVRSLIELMGLTGLDVRRPRQLSGGQQQRVALARALATVPEVLLLDEPFAALDPTVRSGLRDEMVMLHQRTGVPILVVTHDLADAFHFGQSVVVVDHGRVLQQGSREDVFYRPATKRVAEMVGISNLLSTTVSAVTADTVTLDWRGRQLQVAGVNRAPPPRRGERVLACVRSTQIMIKRPEDASTSRPNALHGVIVEESMGSEHYTLLVALSGSAAHHDLEIELPGYTYFRLGLDRTKEIDMSIRPDAIHLISAS
jgi:molybdate transport system ATP-binding protein